MSKFHDTEGKDRMVNMDREIALDVKDLRIRQWKCPKCGAWHDRDLNAAKNILEIGLKMIN